MHRVTGIFQHPVFGAIAATWVIGASTAVAGTDIIDFIQHGTISSSGILVGISSLLLASGKFLVSRGDYLKKKAEAKVAEDGVNPKAYEQVRQEYNDLFHEHIRQRCFNTDCPNRWNYKRDEKPKSAK